MTVKQNEEITIALKIGFKNTYVWKAVFFSPPCTDSLKATHGEVLSVEALLIFKCHLYTGKLVTFSIQAIPQPFQINHFT